MMVYVGRRVVLGGSGFKEAKAMLCPEYYRVRLSAFDQQVFETFVPSPHPLRRALEVIDWEGFYPVLASYYSADQGQPAIDPVRMLKLEYLRYQYHLSDGQVLQRAGTDVAVRYFLQVGAQEPLPDPSSLCVFRGRLGLEGFRAVFDRLVGLAREQGLVKDRLRLKDASHVIANIAVPSTLALVAQMRDRLLDAAEPFAALRTAGERVNRELLRERTAGQAAEQRLEARVTHLREILAWVDGLSPPADVETNPGWQELVAQRRLAHKILADQEEPEAGDRLLSLVDPEARRSKHGHWYDGYLVDVTMDADSELLTQINVLPANGPEAADAAELIRREEQAHGNRVEALSIDGIGFNGPVLRELEDPQGLALNVLVPPPETPPPSTFTPDDFREDREQGCVQCPAGQTSRYRERDQRNHGWVYRFQRTTCAGCPLMEKCMSHPPRGRFGRTIRKNDYEAEYQRARQKATTAEYAVVRAVHRKVERKLGELLNRHGGRRASYWGVPKVLQQELMAGLATNVNRLVRLHCAPRAAWSCAA